MIKENNNVSLLINHKRKYIGSLKPELNVLLILKGILSHYYPYFDRILFVVCLPGGLDKLLLKM